VKLELGLELERVLCADGMVGDDGQACRRGIAEGEGVLAAVTEGAELLVPGARLHSRWAEHGAMAHEGFAATSGWDFFRP